MRSGYRFAILTAVLLLGACGTQPVTGSPRVDQGPSRPSAVGDRLDVVAQNLDAPVVLDPIPDGLRLRELTYNPSDTGYPPPTTTLYGDPSLADTLDGPVLLVGAGSGSAEMVGPPVSAEDGTPVDRVPVFLGIGVGFGFLIHDGDTSWVSIPTEGYDYNEFAVGRGISDEDLIRAAAGAQINETTATIDTDSVPSGLAPLITGSGQGGPYSSRGEGIRLTDSALPGVQVYVQAVRADPRLAALWGFWVADPIGTVVRGQPGSVGEVAGTQLGDGPRGLVWAEAGMVLSVIADGASDELVEQVVSNLRVGTEAELEEQRIGLIAREPTPEDVGCPPGAMIVSASEGAFRWAWGLGTYSAVPDPYWDYCAGLITPDGGASGVSSGIDLAPIGEISADAVTFPGESPPALDGTMLGGVAPPGTERVTIAGPGGVFRDALLLTEGPRPGERVFGQYLVGVADPTGLSLGFEITALDAAGSVIATLSL